MRKNLVFTVACVIFLLNYTFGIQTEPSRNKNILVLFSFVPTTPAYRPILEGIRQKLMDEFGDKLICIWNTLKQRDIPKANTERKFRVIQ